MKQGKLYIGTAGWVYSHWDGTFYPEDLLSKDKLKYFSQHFKTAEINYSFYHLPRLSTYQNWYNQTPEDFLFAVKASRFITHIKRLKGVGSAWRQFLDNALTLKEKLGPILFQFPPSFKATEENIKRLEKFLKMLRGRTSRGGPTSENQKMAKTRIKCFCLFQQRCLRLRRQKRQGALDKVDTVNLMSYYLLFINNLKRRIG